MARVRAAFKSPSKRPRFRRMKQFVEGDRYALLIQILNESADPFPPSDMELRFRCFFPNGQIRTLPLDLKKGRIAANDFAILGDEHDVMAPGFALLRLDYRPYGSGCVIHTLAGEIINPTQREGKTIAQFHAASLNELRTLYGLYIAAGAAVLSGIGLILSAIFR